jgi:hypothetical protein
VKQVQTDIGQAVENFRCYNVVLKFTTIPPASLLNVADHFSHKFSQEDSQIILNEQKNFEYDVDLLNSFITSVNIIHGTKTVRWDTDLVKYILNEGEPIRNLNKLFTTDMLTFMMVLHPHMSLSELWLNVMCDSINRDLPCAVANENGVVEDEDLGVVDEELEEMEENDSWDFKRIV